MLELSQGASHAQAELVLPLKDPTSDMAVISRNGSKLVKEVRDKKEANKSRARFWEVAGSKMGKITGKPLITALWSEMRLHLGHKVLIRGCFGCN